MKNKKGAIIAIICMVLILSSSIAQLQKHYFISSSFAIAPFSKTVITFPIAEIVADTCVGIEVQNCSGKCFPSNSIIITQASAHRLFSRLSYNHSSNHFSSISSSISSKAVLCRRSCYLSWTLVILLVVFLSSQTS